MQLVTFTVISIGLPSSFSRSVCGRGQKLFRGSKSETRLELRNIESFVQNSKYSEPGQLPGTVIFFTKIIVTLPVCSSPTLLN